MIAPMKPKDLAPKWPWLLLILVAGTVGSLLPWALGQVLQ